MRSCMRSSTYPVGLPAPFSPSAAASHSHLPSQGGHDACSTFELLVETQTYAFQPNPDPNAMSWTSSSASRRCCHCRNRSCKLQNETAMDLNAEKRLHIFWSSEQIWNQMNTYSSWFGAAKHESNTTRWLELRSGKVFEHLMTFFCAQRHKRRARRLFNSFTESSW